MEDSEDLRMLLHSDKQENLQSILRKPFALEDYCSKNRKVDQIKCSIICAVKRRQCQIHRESLARKPLE